MGNHSTRCELNVKAANAVATPSERSEKGRKCVSRLESSLLAVDNFSPRPVWQFF